MRIAHKAELAFILMNVCAALPFVGLWWMAIPQLTWAACKFARACTSDHKIDEKNVF